VSLCGDENSLSPQLIPLAPEMVAATAEVNAGQRCVQLVVSEHNDNLVVFVQVLVQQHLPAMLSVMEPDLSNTSSTSTGTLSVLAVCIPQLASAVGVEPVPELCPAPAPEPPAFAL
jgi:hypothetical protein